VVYFLNHYAITQLWTTGESLNEKESKMNFAEIITAPSIIIHAVYDSRRTTLMCTVESTPKGYAVMWRGHRLEKMFDSREDAISYANEVGSDYSFASRRG